MLTFIENFDFFLGIFEILETFRLFLEILETMSYFFLNVSKSLNFFEISLKKRGLY